MSLDPGEELHEFVVIRGSRRDGIELDQYEHVDLGTATFELYQKKNGPRHLQDSRAQ